MVSWCKKGECNAQTSPKSELCGFKWANTHNKCVHSQIRQETHVLCGCTTFGTELKLGPKLIRSLRLL